MTKLVFGQGCTNFKPQPNTLFLNSTNHACLIIPNGAIPKFNQSCMFDHSKWHCQTIRVIYPSLKSLYFSVRHYIKQEKCHLEIASTERDAIKLGISQVVFSVNAYTE
ncbi:hypothetical protein PanWU01x14_082030 [Parasponia andersonii]|uniref:Uncharacterized protein n=1 Tax=Parasponia andersonii TaxID=3476 RepID=A0A2P5DAH2_PARAD|nr:hypothetical protein PanWU01x14_082030 [Parasponia andersonii]